MNKSWCIKKIVKLEIDILEKKYVVGNYFNLVKLYSRIRSYTQEIADRSTFKLLVNMIVFCDIDKIRTNLF